LQVHTPDYPDVPPQEVHVTIRDCIPGEATTDIGCTQCPPNQYSFQAGPNCTLCDANAVCDGGAVFAPKQGFWHSASNSSSVQPCPNRAACQGGRAPLVACQASGTCSSGAEYQTLQCSSGYGGNLCGSCRKDQGYGVGAYLRCSKCTSLGASIAALLLMVAVCCAVVLYVAWRSVVEAGRQPAGRRGMASRGSRGEVRAGLDGSGEEGDGKLELSDVFKLLIVHLQYVSIIGNLLVDWPGALRVMLDIVGLLFVAGSSPVVSWDCLGSLGSGAGMALSIAVPLVITLLACVAMARLCHQFQGSFIPDPHSFKPVAKSLNDSVVVDCVVATVLVGVFVFYSVLVSASLSAFACVGVDEESFWIRDMAVQCWSPQHLCSSLFVGLLGVLVFCLLAPALTMWWLARNGSRLDDVAFQRRFGFLYGLYRPSFRFWEGVVCLQTLLLVCIDLFGRRHGPFSQLVLLGLVLVLNHSLAAALRPFRCRPLQRLYAAGTLSLLVTCFGAQWLLQGDSVGATPASYGVQDAVVVTAVATNAAFVAVCALLMAPAVACMTTRSLRFVSTRLQSGKWAKAYAKVQ
jgi:hypothetical protein